MTAKTYTIEFGGYWGEPIKGNVPAKSGVYCVYRCVRDAAKKSVSLKELIYMGESENVNERIADHEKLPDWEKHLKQGEVLCYSFGSVPAASRNRCEAALIFEHKPPENTEYTTAFPFDQTAISLTGKTIMLHEDFTVQRT